MCWAVAQLALLRLDLDSTPERELTGTGLTALTILPHSELIWSSEYEGIWTHILTNKKDVFLCGYSVSIRKV